MEKKKKSVTYAVRKGKTTGLFESWDEVSHLVQGYRGAEYKKFFSREEALEWLGSDGVVKRKIDELERKDEVQIVKRAKVDEVSIHTEKPRKITVYCDGACTGNGTKLAKAAIGIWFGQNHEMNVSRVLPDVMKQTNQTAELYAAITTLQMVPTHQMLLIKTDSMYTINAATKWRVNWMAKQWNLPKLENIVLFRQLSDLIEKRRAPLEWEHVLGHSGVEGNEAADKLASDALKVQKNQNLQKKLASSKKISL